MSPKKVAFQRPCSFQINSFSFNTRHSVTRRYNDSNSASVSKNRRSIITLSSDSDKTYQFDGSEDVRIYDRDEYSSIMDNSSDSDVDDIAKEGEKKLDQVADNVRTDMDNLRASSKDLAERLIAEESQALLQKCEDYQQEMIRAVEKERGILREEVSKLENMLNSYKKETGNKSTSPALKVLFSATFLFGLAAVIYAINAIVTSDSELLKNAMVNAVVAACGTYILSKPEQK